MTTKGKLYLIPSPLGENDPAEVIPGPVLKSLEGFKTFVVEEVRTVRRYLSRAGLKGKIGDLAFYELNEHTDAATIEGYLKLFEEGTTLVSSCNKLLDDAELKVLQLTKGADGEPQETEFTDE